VRVGLSLPQYGFSLPGREPVTFDACAAWATRAESLGFDSVCVSDHLFYSFARYGARHEPIAALEAMTTLAGLAARTERVRLGTLVLCAPFRHPGLLAKTAATIDRLSGGRVDLGVGAGWLEEEFLAFGYRFGTVGERFAILEQTLQVLDGFCRGDAVTSDGPAATLRAAPATPSPAQRPIPVWVGGKGGPRLLSLAARYAAGWNVVWRMAPEAYAAKVRDVESVCETVGRDPATFRRSVGLYGLIGEDDASARGVFERARAAMPGDAMRGETYDSWRADTLSGTPEQILQRIHSFADLGVEEIVVAPWVLPFAIPEPEQVDIFVERVLAPLRARGL
jgi:probable F420-dependent oxidoreductase